MEDDVNIFLVGNMGPGDVGEADDTWLREGMCIIGFWFGVIDYRRY